MDELAQVLVPLGGKGEPRSRAAAVGRLTSYSLRVSLLEQCQLRCGYCLPGAAQSFTDKGRWLRASDYARLAPHLAARGVDKLRFTGGEPLLRDDVAEVVAAFRRALPGADLALTTNGQRLDRHLDKLAAAGLDRLTVHLDTLKPERYVELMGPGLPDEVLALSLAAKGRLGEVKLNMVAQRGLNHDELLDFLALSRETGLEVRFIELMNTGSAPEHVQRAFISGAELLAGLRAHRPVSALPRRRASDPAALYRCDDDGTVFGIIASDTEPFCERCDRLRLTAEGRLKGCLYQPGGVPLGEALRAGASDEALRELLDAGLDDKRPWHPSVAEERPAFSMADVGG
jgi:GTP 3',8-cyclase